MSEKQELINFIMSMTPEQSEKVAKRLDIIKQALDVDDDDATCISHLRQLINAYE